MKSLRLLLMAIVSFAPALAVAQQKKIYLAPDDHTDFIWSATEHDSYAPLTPLVVTWGAVPAEGVLRALYFPGHLERTHGVPFPVAQAMENRMLPLGLGSLAAGAGAKYFWHGGYAEARDLTKWRSTGTDVVQRWQVIDGGAFESITARDLTIAGPAAPRRFMRLKVTQSQ